jgi:hypothetical protein
MSAHDEQIKNQAHELGRMLATAGSFTTVAEEFARGYAEAQAGDAQRRARLALVGADALAGGAEEVRRWLVDDARTAGLPWSGIGEALGISKQAAQQRYGAPR